MKKIVCGLALLIFTFGCASMGGKADIPSHISIPNKINIMGTTAKFESCNMSVNFSGTPRPFSKKELKYFDLPKFYNWEVEVLAYEQHRLSEAALCVCRDLEFSLGEINESGRNLNLGFLSKATTKEYNRKVEFEIPAGEGGIVEHGQIIYPITAPKCIFLQDVQFDPSTSSASTKFFESLTDHTGEASPQLEGSPSVQRQSWTSVSELLEELRNLFNRDLITKEEYEQKRKEILDGF